jgi:short subunit dehydrogenase-like uncharacterized protein
MRSSDPVLVFGATGYTAGLILEAARKAGLAPIVSARHPQRLAAVSERFDLEQRLASLDDPASLRRALAGVRVVLNAAGPFIETTQLLLRACLEAGSHYLDISGEVRAFELAAQFHSPALRAGVTVLPGVGFDVVPSDCLCVHVQRRLPAARKLRIAISGLELMSPGSVRTLLAEVGQPTKVRRGGALEDVPAGSLVRNFDWGAGPRACVGVSWGDLVTAYYSTGISEIETYFESTPAIWAMTSASRGFGPLYELPWVKPLLLQQMQRFLSPPTAAERSVRSARVVVEAEDAAGRVATSLLTTPEAYTLTAETAIAITRRVVSGDVEPGFQTPARLFGPNFILGFSGVSRVDLETQT